MALVPIKTASTTGYCDCIHGCYELASLRDEETGKGYCPACGKDHLEMNKGIGLPNPAPSKITASTAAPSAHPLLPSPANRLDGLARVEAPARRWLSLAALKNHRRKSEFFPVPGIRRDTESVEARLAAIVVRVDAAQNR